jgi:hypothetical protein
MTAKKKPAKRVAKNKGVPEGLKPYLFTTSSTKKPAAKKAAKPKAKKPAAKKKAATKKPAAKRK